MPVWKKTHSSAFGSRLWEPPGIGMKQDVSFSWRLSSLSWPEWWHPPSQPSSLLCTSYRTSASGDELRASKTEPSELQMTGEKSGFQEKSSYISGSHHSPACFASGKNTIYVLECMNTQICTTAIPCMSTLVNWLNTDFPKFSSWWLTTGMKWEHYITWKKLCFNTLTFKEVIGPEAFTILDIFHHVVGKLVHMARGPERKREIIILIQSSYQWLLVCYI